jgi:hypothetical protein
METKDDRRKRRLAQLALEKGGVRAVAAAAGVGWEGLDQVLKGTLLKSKADGTRNPKALGDSVAEAIEDAYGLGRGWFDWPFDLVDYKRYYALTPEQRAVTQDRMMQEVRRFEAEHPEHPPFTPVRISGPSTDARQPERKTRSSA